MVVRMMTMTEAKVVRIKASVCDRHMCNNDIDPSEYQVVDVSMYRIRSYG